MTDSGINQAKTNTNFYLHKRQSELIQAKTTLEKVLIKVQECNTGEGNTEGDILAKIIQEASGDNATTSIWHLEKTIKYLEAILADNQMCIELINRFSKN
jgi:hypothetical protein